MPQWRYVLCRRNFDDAFVARILAATPPGWHVTQSWEPVDAARLGPRTLFVLGGTNQSSETLTVRPCGGAATGTFSVRLRDLPSFFGNWGQTSSNK